MTRKEKIIEILDKYWIRRGWIESDESMVEARPLTAKEELADAIMALPIEVPSEEEIKTEANKVEYRNIPTYDTQRVTFKIAVKWAINEILKRNKIE